MSLLRKSTLRATVPKQSKQKWSCHYPLHANRFHSLTAERLQQSKYPRPSRRSTYTSCVANLLECFHYVSRWQATRILWNTCICYYHFLRLIKIFRQFFWNILSLSSVACQHAFLRANCIYASVNASVSATMEHPVHPLQPGTGCSIGKPGQRTQ